MKITDSEIIKNGEQELIDAITADLDWGAIEEVFLKEHNLGIEEDIEYKKGDIVAVNNQIAYKLEFEVKVNLSVLLNRNGEYLSVSIYNQKEQLEATLSRLSQAYAVKQKIAKAEVEKVANALPANTVLIEFARVEMFNFKAKGQEEQWNPAHYLAFVLHAGNGEKVGLIDLGEADMIDQAVAAFKKQITRGRIEKRSFEALTTSSEQVYKLVFAPLQEELGEVKEIFISPDGNLNLIPFEVLIGPDGRFLIEEHTFNYLAAGRDILGFGEIQEESNNPLLMGDPDFDFAPGINARAESVSRLKPATSDAASPEGALASLSLEPGALAPVE